MSTERRAFFKLLLPIAGIVFAADYVMSSYAQSIGDLCQPGVHSLCTPLYISMMTAGVFLLFGTAMLLSYGKLFPKTKAATK